MITTLPFIFTHIPPNVPICCLDVRYLRSLGLKCQIDEVRLLKLAGTSRVGII